MPFDKDKMKSLRLKLAMSQEDAAKKAGLVQRQAWYRYETGTIAPSIETAERIAKALGVSVCDLIKEAGRKSR